MLGGHLAHAARCEERVAVACGRQGHARHRQTAAALAAALAAVVVAAAGGIRAQQLSKRLVSARSRADLG